MFIEPIKEIKISDDFFKINKNDTNNIETNDGTSVFTNVFKEAVKNVKDTENALSNEQYLLATGQTDDPHKLPVLAAKSQLSVDLLVQLRNKALESYNELMRTNI